MDNTFQYFWLFVLAFGSHLFTLLAGCVVTVMLALIEKYALKRKLSVKAEIAILLLFVLFACFQAWQDQYRSRLKADSNTQDALNKFKALTIPNFDEGEIHWISGAPGGNGMDSLITLSAEIINRGAPSIATNMRIAVVTKSRTVEGETLPPPMNDVTLWAGKRHASKYILLSVTGHLPTKALNQPVLTGGAAHGFIQSVIRGLPIQEALAPGSVVELIFEDASGTAYTFKRTIKEQRQPFPDWNDLQKGIKDRP